MSVLVLSATPQAADPGTLIVLFTCLVLLLWLAIVQRSRH